MSCKGYLGTSILGEKIKIVDLTREKIPLDSFFERGIADDDCGELVNLALCVPELYVLAVGPSACSKVLYYRAYKKGLNERLFLLAVSSADFATGQHLHKLEEMLEWLAVSHRPRAIIIYMTCGDLLAGSDFTDLTVRMRDKYAIPVKPFERGPLSRRRGLPRERLSGILVDLLEMNTPKGEKRHFNILADTDKLSEASGLKQILTDCGAEGIREFAALESYEAFAGMVNARLNIALDRFGCEMAARMREKWNIPFVFLPARYNVKEIKGNYAVLLEALQVTWDVSGDEKKYHRVAAEVSEGLSGKKIAVGIGQRSFELTQALVELGLDVALIFVETVSKPEIAYIQALAAMNSSAEIYLISNISAETQANDFQEIDIAIGEKASFYCDQAKAIPVSNEYRFGYEDILGILEAIR